MQDTLVRAVVALQDFELDGLEATPPLRPKLHLSTYPLRVGSADVGLFFTIHSKFDAVWLAPVWLEGREVIVVFEDRADPKPSYMMWLEWRDGRISFIRDYRYARYVIADAELALAPDAKPAGDRRALMAPAESRGRATWHHLCVFLRSAMPVRSATEQRIGQLLRLAQCPLLPTTQIEAHGLNCEAHLTGKLRNQHSSPSSANTAAAERMSARLKSRR